MPKWILNKDEIRKHYEVLLEGKVYTPQKRGFEFEQLIFSVLQNEFLEPKASYKPKGEQVDGSFFWQGQTFLIEAKWVNDPLPASSIYAFKGKLDGKFHTTSGVFISISGYSEDVEDALKFGKSLNILLFDFNDISLVFNGKVSFLEMLKFKLRAAGDTGSLKVPFDLKEKAKEISEAEWIEDIKLDIGSTLKTHKRIKTDDLLVFVEGKTDIPIISNLFNFIKSRYSLSYKIESLNGANNIRQLPSLVNIYGSYKNAKAVIVILDEDQENSAMEGIINNVTEQFQNSAIYVSPIFLFIGDKLKTKLLDKDLNLKDLRKEPTFEKLEAFIQDIEEDYYDPEKAIPQSALLKELDRLEWDFKDHVIYASSEEHSHLISLESLEDLIEHLNEVMIQAAIGEMPTSWLKERDDFLDYAWEVREHLYDNYKKEIKKLGWNINDL